MDGLSSVGWDLLYSTHIPNFKCLYDYMQRRYERQRKKSRFEPPFGGLRGTHRVHKWSMARRKRTVECRLSSSNNWNGTT